VDAAEEHLRAAVQGYRAAGELDRGELPRTLANLAVLQIGRGDLDAAASTAQEALDRTRERHGADHPLTASAQAHVAAIHAQRGEHVAARDAWLEVLRVRRALYPEGHVLLAQTLHHLGIVLVQGGSPDEAEPYLREASTILEAAEDSPALAAERASLELTMGAWAMSLDRRDEARTHLERARDEFTQLQGPDSAGAESARAYLARLSD
jgi:tetratricopeptide (TPR) repeat protein